MLYTVKQLSKALGKSEETIRRWCRNGKVKSTKKSKKDGYIIEYDILVESKCDYKHFMIKCSLHMAIDKMSNEQLDELANFIANLNKAQ